MSKSFNSQRSQEWANVVEASPNHCFRNSVVTALSFSGEISYVEGWALEVRSSDEAGVFRHGWCVSNDEIIDVTRVVSGKNSTYFYFPGYECSPEDLRNRFDRGKGEIDVPISRGFTEYSINQREFQVAFRAAVAQLHALPAHVLTRVIDES